MEFADGGDLDQFIKVFTIVLFSLLLMLLLFNHFSLIID